MIEGIKLLGDMVALQVVAESREVPKRHMQTGEIIEGEFTKEFIVPTTGIIAQISAQIEDPQALNFKEGDIVMLPSGNMIKLTDPRVVSGELDEDDDETANYVMTHYKNIAVVYTAS